MTDIAASYNEVLYPSYPLPQAHPDRLATLGTLFGMQPAAVERCRVLEVGCGNGNHIIPMALTLPESRFVGVDLAAQPIALGQHRIASLGLGNIELRCHDIMDMDAGWGSFDYIIAHGLYSWVPAIVREQLLAICKKHLTPQGIAYISYNTYPGCHVRRMLRDMMLFHVRPFADPEQRIQQSLALLQMLAAGQTRNDAYSLLLQQELEGAEHRDHAELLFHDDLADINEPVYFHEFVAHAGRHRLQFLAESTFYEMQHHIYPPQVAEQLERLAEKSVLAKEQYLDFLKCRRFRQTLLCHPEVALERRLRPEQMMAFAVTSAARATAERPDLAGNTVEEFRGPHGAVMQTDHPLAKTVIWHLGQVWPQARSFGDLLTEALAHLGWPAAGGDLRDHPQARVLAEVLLGTYAAGLVDLHVYVPAHVARAGDKPVASPLARRQVLDGEDVLTSLWHTTVQVEDPAEQHLLPLLDGTRDRAALVDALKRLVDDGTIVLERESPRDAEQRALLATRLEQCLARFAHLALLTG